MTCSLSLVFWIALVTLVPALFGMMFTFFPQRIIQWQGRFYRNWYKEHLQMPNGAIDKLPRAPTDTYLAGSRSHFINRAPEHPNQFPRLIVTYRAMGCFAFALLILAITLLVWGSVTGRMTIVC